MTSPINTKCSSLKLNKQTPGKSPKLFSKKSNPKTTNSCLDTKEFTSIKEHKQYLIKKFINSIKREINSSLNFNKLVKDSSSPPKSQKNSKSLPL